MHLTLIDKNYQISSNFESNRVVAKFEIICDSDAELESILKQINNLNWNQVNLIHPTPATPANSANSECVAKAPEKPKLHLKDEKKEEEAQEAPHIDPISALEIE